MKEADKYQTDLLADIMSFRSAFLSSLALLLVSFVFILYSAEVNQLPGFYEHFICCSMELSHVPGFFYYYFWRVEVKLNYCSLEVHHEPGLFCIFTLSGSLAWLFFFLSSIALKLTSLLDFISILSAVAWNYPQWQVFFFFFLIFISGGLKLS